MIYFPSEFINALSAYDKRLTPHGAADASELLIEEADIPLLDKSINTSLIVLTDDREKCLRTETEHRYVYKFQEVRRLIAEIFGEPHEVRHFLILGTDELPERLFLKGCFVDILSCLRFTDSLITTDRFLNSGIHYLYSSILDLLDPPTEKIAEIIDEQSKVDCVDLVSFGIHGQLTDLAMRRADINYVLPAEKYVAVANELCSSFDNAALIKLPISDEDIELISQGSQK
ncbi:hypothetical protein [Bacteroides heparinolyticus]|uniref:hypothetical protein n=1 Tax=Prevotella heparinolytica TaxID=28113 RepID=UPI0035A06CF2